MSLQTDDRPFVAVIDDDANVRDALKGLFRSVGIRVELFESTDAYAARVGDERPSCMVLDVRLPGRSGLEFQDELAAYAGRPPIIFISGHADVPMSVRAMKAGAIEFLTKPVRDQDLLDAVQTAMEQDRLRRHSERHIQQVRADFATLTPRERDVLTHVVAGRRNKDIAGDLGLSEATVKLHRSHIMQKLRVQSLVELVRTTDLHAQSERGSTKV